MTDNDTNLPAAAGASLAAHFSGSMSPALAIMLDPVMFERAKQIATYLSRAEGFCPPHLLGKTEACFAVVTRALTWKLDPFAVAQSTYQTPGGRVGYEGKLCQAIIENSGQLKGPVRYEHYGDWSRVKGKFVIRKSDKGKDYTAIGWTREDAKGLGVMVRAQIIGEPEMREWPLDLDQCFPLNSTLWATDPKTQICYTAVRRFASVACPGLIMGVPFERGEGWSDEVGNPSRAKDVTPKVRPAGKSKLEHFVDTQQQARANGEVAEEDLSQDGPDDHAVEPDTGEPRQLEPEPGPDPTAEPEPPAAKHAHKAKAEAPHDRDTIPIQWPGGKHPAYYRAEYAVQEYHRLVEGRPAAWRNSCLELNPELAALVDPEGRATDALGEPQPR